MLAAFFAVWCLAGLALCAILDEAVMKPLARMGGDIDWSVGTSAKAIAAGARAERSADDAVAAAKKAEREAGNAWALTKKLSDDHKYTRELAEATANALPAKKRTRR